MTLRAHHLVIGLLGLSIAVPAPSKSPWADRADLAERAEFRQRLANMIEAIEDHYVDEELPSQHVVRGAIRGMLDTLDPHSNYLEPDAYRGMRQNQDGSFYGLGIIISVRRDSSGTRRLTVISPIDGTPAKRLGVRAGDIIAAISGEPTDDLTLDGAVAKLRGRKGTTVNVTIERGSESIDLDIERAEIPTESVPHAYMLEPGTGFIRIKDFTRTTKPELDQALEKLMGEGMEQLILDLRDNPGGLLDAAVDVSGTFLEPGDLVVETRGRDPEATERRLATRGGYRLPEDVPVIALINRGSASASEIVSGSIQDHDRGLVVGTTSWGKGLVQSVYSLSFDSGLALTTARYYTPSGRQIQRDYRSSYFDYYFPREGAGPQGETHQTVGGREVQSGGGIAPDVEVEIPEAPSLVSKLIAGSWFYRYAAHHEELGLAPVKSPSHRLKQREMEAFEEFLASGDLEVDAAKLDEALTWIRPRIVQELVSRQVGWKEGFQVLNEVDPVVRAAVELFPRANRETLLADARQGRRVEVEVHEGTVEAADGAPRVSVFVRESRPDAPGTQD
ncbi:MAG: S41 family peptidase [Acidobacteriota bacterium]